MKRFYIPPTLSLQRSCGKNPVALRGAHHACECIDGVAMEDLAQRHGSPLFVFSETTLRETHRRISGAFKSRYNPVQFAWSYKTNYLKAICRIFHEEGSLAEVVSGFEYEKARANHIKGSDIIFNGPCKTRPEIELAVSEGARIQVDHFEELALVEQVARDQGGCVSIGLRLCLDTGIRPLWTKFGFRDGEELAEAIRWISLSKGMLRLDGFHCHVGTYILDPHAYRSAVERIIELADQAEAVLGRPLSYFNLGGGFPSSATLHGQFQPARETNPKIEEYADAICEPLNHRFGAARKRPLLLLETGRAMVDDAGYLITTVIANKRSGSPAPVAAKPSGADPKRLVPEPPTEAERPAILIDAGIHLLYPAAWYQLDIRTARIHGGERHSTRVLGCLCMNIDVVREAAPLPSLRRGDRLVIHPVGAYCFTQSMQFITYRPRIVLIDETGRDHIIREGESLAYIEELEQLPAHLQANPPLRRSGYPHFPE